MKVPPGASGSSTTRASCWVPVGGSVQGWRWRLALAGAGVDRRDGLALREGGTGQGEGRAAALRGGGRDGGRAGGRGVATGGQEEGAGEEQPDQACGLVVGVFHGCHLHMVKRE